MRRTLVVFVAVLMLVAAHGLAQTTPPTPKTPASPPTPSAPAPPMPRPGQPINIRVDTTISESGGNGAPVKKNRHGRRRRRIRGFRS